MLKWKGFFRGGHQTGSVCRTHLAKLQGAIPSRIESSRVGEDGSLILRNAKCDFLLSGERACNKPTISDVIVHPSNQDVRTVPLGLRFQATTASGDIRSFTVAEKCSTNVGYWYCYTHDVGFPNQFAKDTHIDIGYHMLAWNCKEHGPEVP